MQDHLAELAHLGVHTERHGELPSLVAAEGERNQKQSRPILDTNSTEPSSQSSLPSGFAYETETTVVESTGSARDAVTGQVAEPDHGDAMEQQLRQLAEELHVRGREIDELQARQEERTRPWYRQASIVVAIAALLVSLVSGGVGAILQSAAESRARRADERAIAQQQQQDRSDLRTILQRLAALPRENATLYQQFGQSAAALSVNVTSETSLLVGQANTIVDRIPNLVSAAEYNALGTATLLLPGTQRQATMHFEQAAGRADNLNDQLTAVRSLAILGFTSGSLDEGRGHFNEALQLINKAKPLPFWDAYITTETRMQWARQELVHDCNRARTQLNLGKAAAERQNLIAAQPQAIGGPYEELRALVATCARPSA